MLKTKTDTFLNLKNLKNKKIVLGVPENYFLDFLHPEVEHIFCNFLKSLSSYNIKLEPIELHNSEKYYKSWRDVRLAEASEIHQVWLNSKKFYYSSEVKKMLIEGTKVSAIDYLQAMHIIKEIRKEFLSLLQHKVDAIIVPTTVIPAPKLDRELGIYQQRFFNRYS